MSKPPKWFDSSQIGDVRPPVYIPETPPPDWVRTAIGSRQITPSASLFVGGEILGGEVLNEDASTSTELDLTSLDLTDSNHSKDSTEEAFSVDVKVLSTLCHVKWKAPAKYARDYKLSLKLSCGGMLVEEKDISLLEPFYEFDLTPGRRYRVEVTIVHRETNEVLETFTQNFHSVFSQIELDALYLLARKFVEGKPLQMIKVLYRVKPKRYFQDIDKYSDGIMIPYLKDNSGHLASPINRKLKGLFFLGSTQNGALPPTSPFGDMRFTVPVLSLLDPSDISVYFTDFYCSNRRHYVTAVVCKKGSESDEFCKENTKLLDLETNPFLRIVRSTRGPEHLVFVNNHVHVEICYTEKIPLTLGEFKPVQAFGTGTSTFGGLPNNKSCPKCNLMTAKKRVE